MRVAEALFCMAVLLVVGVVTGLVILSQEDNKKQLKKT